MDGRGRRKSWRYRRKSVHLRTARSIGVAEERAEVRGEFFHAGFRAVERAALVVVHAGKPLAFRHEQDEADHHGGHEQEQQQRGDERNARLFFRECF